MVSENRISNNWIARPNKDGLWWYRRNNRGLIYLYAVHGIMCRLILLPRNAVNNLDYANEHSHHSMESGS